MRNLDLISNNVGSLDPSRLWLLDDQGREFEEVIMGAPG